MSVFIASIDPGKKNFAFSIEEIFLDRLGEVKTPEDVYRIGKTVICDVVDISTNSDKNKKIDNNVFINLTITLDKYRSYWDKCSTILIERQMSFHGKNNIMAIKIAQHCLSYFLITYSSFKNIVDYPAYHKTQVLGAEKGLDKPARKKWAIKKALDILERRGDTEMLERFRQKKKRDDISDCLLMNLSYVYQTMILKKSIK